MIVMIILFALTQMVSLRQIRSLQRQVYFIEEWIRQNFSEDSE